MLISAGGCDESLLEGNYGFKALTGGTLDAERLRSLPPVSETNERAPLY